MNNQSLIYIIHEENKHSGVTQISYKSLIEFSPDRKQIYVCLKDIDVYNKLCYVMLCYLLNLAN